MSQKVGKISSEDKESKALSKEKESSENGVEDIKNTSKESFSDAQGEIPNVRESSSSELPSRRSKRTRSRSKTPQIKNGVDKTENESKPTKLECAIEEKEEHIIEETPIQNAEVAIEAHNDEVTNGKAEITIEETDTPKSSQEVKSSEELNTSDNIILDSESYMDPLILQSDESCPELEFEESSDKDSGKYSPVISRCMTRRSQTRNIPTPKTPKSLFDEQDSEKGVTPASTPDPEEIPKTTPHFKESNETGNSSNTDNLSTKVHVGGDATRLDFSDGESNFLSNLKSKDSNSFPRCISSRRSIKPLQDDIRKKSLRNSMHRANLSIPFFSSRDSVERAPSVKRKSRSETPEDRKRFKDDSPSFMTKITSPLNTLRNKFTGNPNSTSTPKLTSYRDQKNHLGGDFFDQMEMPANAVEPENKWCSIM